MKEEAAVRHPAWTVASLALSAAVLVFTLGRAGPRPEAERVLEAFEAWRAARLARDFDELFELTSAGPLLEEIEWVRRQPRGADLKYWLDLLERADLPPDARDARRLFTGLCRAWPAEHLEREEEWLRALAVDPVEVRGEAGWVRGEEPVLYRLDRAGGDWTVRASPFTGLRGDRSERKLHAFLPRGAEGDHPDHVVEVGPGRPSDADLGSLTALLRAGGREAAVLLDLDPDLAWGDAIRVLDAVLRAGAPHLRFAAAPEPPGVSPVRVDGTLLAGRRPIRVGPPPSGR